MRTLAGVDGCKSGWVAAVMSPPTDVRLRTFASFRELIDELPSDTVVAIDIPIGLPERIIGPGRSAEQAAREVLSKTSSVFSVPCRAAFDTCLGPFDTPNDRKAAYRTVCEIARRFSEPPRSVAQQTFGIMRKIKEVDTVLLDRSEIRGCVIEGHPEIAFRTLNGGREMVFPKKEKLGRGAAERRAVLIACGLNSDVLDCQLPAKVGRDDWFDACAMLLVAERHTRGEAVPHPNPPERDAYGLPIAIWA